MVQTADRFQALEHALDLFFVFWTQQRIARRRQLLRRRRFAPELPIGNPVEQRFTRIAPQMPQQTRGGIGSRRHRRPGRRSRRSASDTPPVEHSPWRARGLVDAPDVAPGNRAAPDCQMALMDLDRRPQRQEQEAGSCQRENSAARAQRDPHRRPARRRQSENRPAGQRGQRDDQVTSGRNVARDRAIHSSRLPLAPGNWNRADVN